VVLLDDEECIELMASVLADLARGAVWQPLRFVVRPPDESSLMGLMPAHRSEPTASYGLKVVCIFPSNAERGIDLHQGGVLLFDGETGALRALVDASAVTATRTAAVLPAFVAVGFAGGLAAAPILSLPVRVLEPTVRAIGMGIFFTLFYVHVVIGPWIGGALATMAGTSRVTFDLGAAMLVLCCAALWLFRRIAAKP